MSIRDRVEDCAINYAIGKPQAALLMALVAVAATSRRRRPPGTVSVRKAGKEMGDGEAFEAFLEDEMPHIAGAKNFNVHYRGELRPLEQVLYKWFRCELLHEAELPPDIVFESDPAPKLKKIEGSASAGKLTLSHGWLDGLIDAVISAPENADQFGNPPAAPFPIHLKKLNLTIK
jgi:hypothetical protein